MRGLLAALLLVMPVTTQAKPEKAITLQDLLSPYVSDVHTYEPDLDSCINSFVVADENKDGVINEHEYVSFVAGIHGGEIAHGGYDNLPLALKLNFFYLSCLCDNEKNCCKGKKGIASGVDFERVCAYTQMTVAYILQEKVETASPSMGSPPSSNSVPSYSPLSSSPSVIMTKDASVTPSTSHSSPVNLIDILPKTPSSSPSVDSARPSLFPTADTSSNALSMAQVEAPLPQQDDIDLILEDSSTAPTIHITNISSAISQIAPPSQSDTGDPTSGDSFVQSSNSINLPPASPSSSFESLAPSPTPSSGWEEQYALQDQSTQEEQSNSLSPVAIVGVAAAVAVVAAAWVAGLFVARRHEDHVDKALDTKYDCRKLDLEVGQVKIDEKKVRLSLQVVDTDNSLSAPELESLSQDESDGSSGWSSSAGLSSLRTATFDSLTDDEMPPVFSKIVNIKAVSAAKTFASVITPTSQSDTLMNGNSINSKGKRASQDDLVAAIEAGDWALVGATAALLASSDHTVASNYQGSVVTNTTDFSLDNSLASQISRLVDSNDWEGVLAAVAMLDGASDSESTTLEQFSPSELQEKADLQALIVELVAEVVPDEMDHLEEMFMQFHNREKELVETLRMMQEKNAEQRKHVKDEVKIDSAAIFSSSQRQ